MAVAEGAALFGSESGDMEVMRAITSVLRNRNSVLQRFTQFSKAANNTRDSDSEETKEWFAAHYGGTYWYYFLFVDIYTKR